MDMSFSSAYKILRKDLKMKSHKITVEPPVKDEHKAQRKIPQLGEKKVRDRRYNFFSDEKILHLYGNYNNQNVVYGPLMGRE